MDKATVCGSGGLTFERTNHTPRNMVIGKLNYWIAPRPEHTSPLSLNVVLMRPHAGARRLTTRRRSVAWILVVEGGGPVSCSGN